MTGRILHTNLRGGSIEADGTKEKYGFTWPQCDFDKNDVGHDTKVKFECGVIRDTAQNVRRND